MRFTIASLGSVASILLASSTVDALSIGRLSSVSATPPDSIREVGVLNRGLHNEVLGKRSYLLRRKLIHEIQRRVDSATDSTIDATIDSAGANEPDESELPDRSEKEIDEEEEDEEEEEELGDEEPLRRRSEIDENEKDEEEEDELGDEELDQSRR